MAAEYQAGMAAQAFRSTRKGDTSVRANQARFQRLCAFEDRGPAF